MYNELGYRGRGRYQVAYQQPYLVNAYAASPNVYPSNQAYPQQGQQARQGRQSQVPIDAAEGILIQNEYEPGRGDPIVVEQAILKCEVVRVGDKSKQVLEEKESILLGEGFASQDGKHWKQVPNISMNVFTIGSLQIRDITKVKARYDGSQSLARHKVLKINCKDKQFFLAFREDIYNEWFLRLVWAKLILEKKECCDYGQWESTIAGKLYKKSFVMGEWQPRVVTIDSRGLRASKDNSSSVNLQIVGTRQIWTRFQQIQGGYYLVVKLWNGILKEEFAVPTAFCLNWLHHFLGLLIPK